MAKAAVAVALGVLLLLLGFGLGTWSATTEVNGVSVSCDPAIDLTRLPFNELGSGPAAPPRTVGAQARREEAACDDATMPVHVGTWTALGLGGLLALAGWTALRERDVASPAPSGSSRLPA